ncbi:MAG TPA: hypothetical protein VFJ06_00575 [Halococcus sp.]|nr:hypothetical protein [Halococcus sp.]
MVENDRLRVALVTPKIEVARSGLVVDVGNDDLRTRATVGAGKRHRAPSRRQQVAHRPRVAD